MFERRFFSGIWLLAFAFCCGWKADAVALEHEHICRFCREGQHTKPDLEEGSVPANGRHYVPDRQVDIRHIKLDVTPDFESEQWLGRQHCDLFRLLSR